MEDRPILEFQASLVLVQASFVRLGQRHPDAKGQMAHRPIWRDPQHAQVLVFARHGNAQPTWH
jgi:hypothetical protein